MRAGSIEALTPAERRRWAAARVWAAHQAPYLATALLTLDPVVIDDADAGVDLSAFPVDEGWRVYIDPSRLANTEIPEVGFWLLHQVTHLLRHHAERCLAPNSSTNSPRSWSRGPEHTRWNVSADAEINDDLRAGEVTLPATAITPTSIEQPDGLTAEQYWDALGLTKSPELPNAPAPCDCGSGCDGESRPWEKPAGGLSQVERMLVDRDVARRIREHVRRRGDMPAGWQRWADEVLEPVVNWRRALASAVRHGAAEVAGRVDFTYRRPSRRAAAIADVVMPSLRQPVPKVAIVIDTSGSMSDEMLSQALAEVSGVLRSLGIARRSLRVVCCDAQAHEAQRVFDPRAIRLLGGGGTDMSAGIAATVALRPRPDLVIVLTDGYTPWPARAPDRVHVVVGLLDSMGTVPPWATSVLITHDAVAR